MNLYQLLNGINYTARGNTNVEISWLACDTKKVKPQGAFICLTGGQADGHDFAKDAVSLGAVALVVERFLELDVVQILVQDTRSVMSHLAKKFFGNACDSLKIVGVVGTNGKTSTTYILNSIFTYVGKKTSVIGTNGVLIDGEKYGSALTTPDPIELHEYFALMVEKGVEFVFIEVSAHAIYYKKLDGVKVAVAVFTNFSQDHLDFFDNMQRYADVKMGYFTTEYAKTSIINADDNLGREIISKTTVPTLSYGYENPSDIFAIDYQETESGIQYTVNACGEISKAKYSLRGKFNMYNTLCATAVARVFGIKLDRIVNGINTLEKIEGRNEVSYRRDGCRIVVDFAHSPDGVENILSHLKNSTNGRLICVFGCGGNRDRFKRPIMGRIISKYCDFAVITDDNPRYEPSADILADIECGMKIDYIVIPDRHDAIEKALAHAEFCDTVAILGKGAERFQEVNGVKIPFSDGEVVKELLE